MTSLIEVYYKGVSTWAPLFNGKAIEPAGGLPVIAVLEKKERENHPLPYPYQGEVFKSGISYNEQYDRCQ